MDPRRRTLDPTRSLRAVITFLVALVASISLLGCADGSTTEATDFEDLAPGTRVYDETGDSLSAAETEDLQNRLETLLSETGADAIAYVREFDAAPEDTLEQVEALQQAWVTAADVDQDNAIAILINRDPGADDEARAGVFVGATYDDGNVPREEQEDIVEDALVPPLRDGDVAGSLDAGVERLGNSIRNGPPTNALNDFAESPGSTWLPWAGLGLVLLGFVGVALIFTRRATPAVPEQPTTTYRPDQSTTPALAGALVAGGPRNSAIPAVILDLAARDAIVIEQEKQKRTFSQGTVQIRLRDRELVRGEIENEVWRGLVKHAEGDLIDSKGLGKVGDQWNDVREIIEKQMREQGWWELRTWRPRAGLVAIGVLALAILIGGIVVGAAGALLMLVAVIPSGLLALTGLVTSVSYSYLSVAGRDAARPWEAYRDGLKAAGKDEVLPLDLDAVLPDVIALNLGDNFKKRLDAATEDGSTTLRAFTPPAGDYAAANPAIFPWAAFTGVFASSSAAGAASGGGAGGGGGAAGGT